MGSDEPSSSIGAGNDALPVVLLVDDDPVSLLALTGVLTTAFEGKASIESFPDATSALSAIDAGAYPAVVVSDQRMPDMSGIELLRKIQDACATTVAIILSGHAEQRDLLEALNRLDLHRYLVKPWDPEDVIDAVRSGLEVWESRHSQEVLASQVLETNAALLARNRELERRIEGSAAPVDPEDLIGQTLDRRFEIVEVLGRGTTGAVYRARHAVLEREYAIKVLSRNLTSDARAWERFRREARAISRLRHANIVGVFDFGTTSEGITFLVMELLDGSSLEKVIDREAPMPVWRVAHIARQLASGLGEAHRAGFVHRDVKPANVLLVNDAHVKILDFGTVGLRAPRGTRRITSEGHVIGTPAYMAPEQLLGNALGPCTDVYSLGVMVFEMLVGQLPFSGTPAEIVERHLEAPPPPLPAFGGLGKLVADMLEKDPRVRMPSMDALIDAIDRLGLASPGSAGGSDAAASRHADGEVVEAMGWLADATPVHPTVELPRSSGPAIPRSALVVSEDEQPGVDDTIAELDEPTHHDA